MAFSDIQLEQKQAALQDLRGIKELFASRNWFPGTSGNLSVRVGEFNPEQFYFAVTASGKTSRYIRLKIIFCGSERRALRSNRLKT